MDSLHEIEQGLLNTPLQTYLPPEFAMASADSEYDRTIGTLLDTILVSPDRIKLDDLLLPAKSMDYSLRKLFAMAPDDPALDNLYVGLIDLFETSQELWKVRGRAEEDIDNPNSKYILPLPDRLRKPLGSASVVPSLEAFQLNWSTFTHGTLSKVNWANMVVAGGSVLACVTPPGCSPADLNDHYQSNYPESDIDVFLYGLNAEEAESKMCEIYDSVRDAVNRNWKVVCVRKANLISIHTLFPTRPIQIILRLYRSPAEILAGFDVDSACCAYDGTTVWMNYRSFAAAIRQANTVDITRRSPSYEVRLAKYAARGYEIYLPSLSREKINPSIFENISPSSLNGLPRLLLLERILTVSKDDLQVPDASYYSLKQVLLRGSAPVGPGRKLGHDTLETNEYDIMWVVPYGPKWNAESLSRAIGNIYDRLKWRMPSNPEVPLHLHRHAIFAGSMLQCLGNFCPDCPAPANDTERAILAAESGKYIRGRVRFIDHNAGRQVLSGSFRPTDADGWEDNAYIGVQDLSIATNVHAEPVASTAAGTVVQSEA